jgi:hypothetical protein
MKAVPKTVTQHMQAIQNDFTLFRDFVGPVKPDLKSYVKHTLLFVMLPASGIAAILFYLLSNPYTGRTGSPSNLEVPDKASVSWWFLFLGARNVATYSFGKAMEFILVQYLATSSPRFIRTVGPQASLLLAQSKGWPCVIFFLGLINFATLYGSHGFAKHWLFYQDAVAFMSPQNPAGNVTDSPVYRNILICLVLTGGLVSVKRYFVGVYLGKRLYSKSMATLLWLFQLC